MHGAAAGLTAVGEHGDFLEGLRAGAALGGLFFGGAELVVGGLSFL